MKIPTLLLIITTILILSDAVTMGRDHLRTIGQRSRGYSEDLVRVKAAHVPDVWHQVKITMKGEYLTAEVDGKNYEPSHPCIAEEKLTFSLGGDSGGPDGESVGSLEFRDLSISELP